MVPFLTECFGNPSGGHGAARAAKQALEEAREAVADALGADPGDVVFTAGGTEADNLAVEGAARAARSAGGGDGIVTTAFEHKGVLAACDRLAREGFRVHRARCRRPRRDRRPRRPRGRARRADRGRLGDAREQRGGDHPAVERRGATRRRTRASCGPPYRRGTGGAVDRRRRGRRRVWWRSPPTSSVDRRAPARSSRAGDVARPADRGRRAGARNAGGNRQRCRRRGDGDGTPPDGRAAHQRGRAHSCVARSPGCGVGCRGSRLLLQRRRRSQGRGELPRRVPWCRGRGVARRARPPGCTPPRGRRARRAPASRRTCSKPWVCLAPTRSRRSG